MNRQTNKLGKSAYMQPPTIGEHLNNHIIDKNEMLTF